MCSCHDAGEVAGTASKVMLEILAGHLGIAWTTPIRQVGYAVLGAFDIFALSSDTERTRCSRRRRRGAPLRRLTAEI